MDFTNRVFVFSLVGSLVLSIFLFLLFNRNYKRDSEVLKELRENYEIASGQLFQAKKKAKDIEGAKAELESLKVSLRRWSESLPTKEDISLWLKEITEAASRAGIDITSYQPKDPIPHDLYVEYPVEIEASSGYHQLGTFLSFIINLPRVMRLSNISLISSKFTEKGLYTLKAKFTLSSYIATLEGKVSPKKKER